MSADAVIPYLAGLVGVYLLLSAAGLLLPATAADEFVSALKANRALAHCVGAVAFFVGGAILLLNHGFGHWVSVLLSLTALWWVAEGAVMLAAPNLIVSRAGAARQLRHMNFVALPLGLALLFGGVSLLR